MSDLYPLQGHELLIRFNALDAFLLDHQHLWRPRPFTVLSLPWEPQHPELAAWLRQRSLEDAEAAHNQPDLLHAPGEFRRWATLAAGLAQVGPLPTAPLHIAAPRLAVDVPGRKWQQIEAFGSRLAFKRPVSHWLDWCAGKGHLGRRLLHGEQTLTCLEHNPALVTAGQQLSDRHHLAANHRQQDVLAADLHLAADQTPVALHACGDLHVRLLQRAIAAGCTSMAIAPCCYNRTAAHEPLSARAGISKLQLSIDDLGLPLSETVTAGARVRRQRDRSMARRLGFDLWQRHARGVDEYLSTPSLPSAWLDKPFAEYCRDLARLKGLNLDMGTAMDAAWPNWQAAGEQRLAQVRNLELVRGLFRRPLELWLVLDRALYLQEHGYHVTLGTFCEPGLTPRNLMIAAETLHPSP